MFCAMKPPRLPSVLMAPMAVAACAPEKRRDGSDQKHGSSSDMHGLPIAMPRKRIQFSPTSVLARNASKPVNAMMPMASSVSDSCFSRRGMIISAAAAMPHGTAESSPFWAPVTPNPFTTVGIQ